MDDGTQVLMTAFVSIPLKVAIKRNDVTFQILIINNISPSLRM